MLGRPSWFKTCRRERETPPPWSPIKLLPPAGPEGTAASGWNECGNNNKKNQNKTRRKEKLLQPDGDEPLGETSSTAKHRERDGYRTKTTTTTTSSFNPCSRSWPITALVRMDFKKDDEGDSRSEFHEPDSDEFWRSYIYLYMIYRTVSEN